MSSAKSLPICVGLDVLTILTLESRKVYYYRTYQTKLCIVVLPFYYQIRI